MHRVGPATFLILIGCASGSETGVEAPPPAATATTDASPIQALPGVGDLDPGKVALGERLFADPALSADGTIACASCHSLATGGVDNRKASIGVGGAVGVINAPTVFNAALNFAQFWNGRAATLEEQAGGPLTAPAEMGSTWPAIVATLRSDPSYVTAFAAAYPDGVTEAAVRDALATFERSLLTPDAPFDRYLRGDAAAITPRARAGYRHFVELGCVACHQGAGVGGNMYQRFGVMGDYFADRGDPTEVDLGRFLVTGDEADEHVFKVPSLRNVARTAPYFHDGTAQTLDDAVHTMAEYQLGRELTDDEVLDIVAFLESLTGTYRGKTL
jgi:cytochrome c peroxidase